VSNPPTHSGREVLDEMVAGAYQVLKPRGQLYLVINRLLSLKREVEEVFGGSEVFARSKGFVVIRAQKQPSKRAAAEDDLPQWRDSEAAPARKRR
jgi:16S rRNA (guanine1207-N2)-methyltransferase